jgi:formamidase
MNRTLGVGTCQIPTIPGNVEENKKNLARQIKILKFYCPWLTFVSAHELCLQGAAGMENTAEEIPGPITEFCSDLARTHEIYLVPGTMYEKEGDRYYNTAPVFDPRGNLIAAYRKMYPWRPYETVTPGNDTVVIDIPGVGTVGICICYDLWFPELIRDLIWKGAELIVIPMSTGTPDRQQELILCRAAAITNQCYIVSVNGTGRSGTGHSLIVDPEGTVIQQTGQTSETMTAMLDLAHVQRIRTYGTCGVTRPVASFFHERHHFGYQNKAHAESPLCDAGQLFRDQGK